MRFELTIRALQTPVLATSLQQHKRPFDFKLVANPRDGQTLQEFLRWALFTPQHHHPGLPAVIARFRLCFLSHSSIFPLLTRASPCEERLRLHWLRSLILSRRSCHQRRRRFQLYPQATITLCKIKGQFFTQFKA